MKLRNGNTYRYSRLNDTLDKMQHKRSTDSRDLESTGTGWRPKSYKPPPKSWVILVLGLPKRIKCKYPTHVKDIVTLDLSSPVEKEQGVGHLASLWRGLQPDWRVRKKKPSTSLTQFWQNTQMLTTDVVSPASRMELLSSERVEK